MGNLIDSCKTALIAWHVLSCFFCVLERGRKGERGERKGESAPNVFARARRKAAGSRFCVAPIFYLYICLVIIIIFQCWGYLKLVFKNKCYVFFLVSLGASACC